MIPENIEDLYYRAEGEVFGGKLNFQEIGLDDLIAWVEWVKTYQPVDLKEMDILSVMMLFEEWVKKPLGKVK